MEGPWVSNLLEPFNVVNQTSVNLTATSQAVYATSQLANVGNGFFGYAGKTVHFRGVGNVTSAATPGNFGLAILYGSNANNTGTQLCSVLVTWTANQANTTFMFDFWCKCRTPGSSGTLVCEGWMFIQGTSIIQNAFSAPFVSTVNLLTNPMYLSPQVSRTGSTLETCNMYDIFYESVN